MTLRDVIADQINEDRHTGWYGSISGADITQIEVRRGCGEIKVEFKDGEDLDFTQVDAAPILTYVLNEMLTSEG